MTAASTVDVTDMSKVPLQSEYNALLKNLREEIDLGISGLREHARRQTIQTYWNVGRQVSAFLNDHPGTAGLYEQLAEDTGIHHKTFYECVKVFRAYPAIDLRRPVLTWSHYRHLASISSKKERRMWETRVLKEQLPVKTLLTLLRQPSLPPLSGRKKLKGPLRGKLYHYRLKSVANILTDKKELYVDCGFDNYIRPPAASARLVNKYVYASRKEEGRYALNVTKESTAALYTYAATIEQIIDADTFLMLIDCGFGHYRREWVRLTHINAPEKDTIDGLRATRWVHAALKDCPFVIIRTHKTDRFSRYLIDLFFHPRAADPHTVAAKGAYLNQVMLDEGMAVAM